MKVIHGFMSNEEGWTYEHIQQVYHPTLENIAIANETGIDGIALSPVFEATLLEKYLALNIYPFGQRLEGALFSPVDESFMVFDEALSKWIPTEEIVYYPDTQLTNYIQHWYKALQIRIKIPPSAYFYELKIGAEILVSYNDYLLSYALVEHLTNPVHFGFVAYPDLSTPTQSNISFPSLFDQRIQNLVVRQVGSDYFYANPSLADGIVTVPEEANSPVMVTFDYTPQVRFIKFGAYQIEQLPSIIIKQKQETNIRRGYMREQMALDPAKRSPETTLESRLFATYDIPIEVMFVAPDISFCQIMFEEIMKKSESRPINVRATGDQVGLSWGSVIRRDTGTTIETKPLIDSLASIIVSCTLINIAIVN